MKIYCVDFLYSSSRAFHCAKLGMIRMGCEWRLLKRDIACGTAKNKFMGLQINLINILGYKRIKSYYTHVCTASCTQRTRGIHLIPPDILSLVAIYPNGYICKPSIPQAKHKSPFIVRFYVRLPKRSMLSCSHFIEKRYFGVIC